MATEVWVGAVVALVTAGVSGVIALVTLGRQGVRHREELAAAHDKLQREQRFSDLKITEAVEREHFARLWDVRKDSYSRLAAWLMEFRENIRTYRDDVPWTPQGKLESLMLGQIIIYGDYEVYAKAELLRGGYEATVDNQRTFGDQMPPGFMKERLEQFSEDAFQLLMVVREEALTLPDWGEPIPLRKDAAPLQAV
jgi:hypothetical protein